MVSHPVHGCILERYRVEDHQDDLEWQAGLVSLVRPQTVRAGCYADFRDHKQDEFLKRKEKLQISTLDAGLEPATLSK